jgi:hypothetical protein
MYERRGDSAGWKIQRLVDENCCQSLRYRSAQPSTPQCYPGAPRQNGCSMRSGFANEAQTEMRQETIRQDRSDVGFG